MLWLFLHVRGESDPIGLYPMLFGPLAVLGLCGLALGEGVVRGALTARRTG